MPGSDDLVARLRRPILFGASAGALVNPDGPEAADEIERLTAEVKEHELRFEVAWDCAQRAIKIWQDKHPGNDLVWPDHAELCVWLMGQLDDLTKQRNAALCGPYPLRDEIERLTKERDELVSRTTEYARQNANLEAIAATATRERDEARAEVERKDAALSLYADRSLYVGLSFAPDPSAQPLLAEDAGAIARAALYPTEYVRADLLATARAEARNQALEEAAPVIAELAGVIWQMLDDMGEHGHGVCEAAKAAARAALGRVAAPSLEIDYTMAQAEACFAEVGGKPRLALGDDELVEPWATAIRALIAPAGEG